MTRLMIRPLTLLVALLPVTLAGCTSKPIDELNMARISMGQARDSEATEYAPREWDRARANWEEANALIQIGRYEEARDTLTRAIANFNEARDVATRRLKSVQIEIDALQKSLKNDLGNLEQAVEKARVRPSVRSRIDRGLPLIDEKIAVMRAALEEKQYLRARTAGNEAEQSIHDLQERVSPGR